MRTPRLTTLAVCVGLTLAAVPTVAAAAPAPRQGSAATAATAATASGTLLRIGQRGPAVRDWQALVNRLVGVGAVPGPAVQEDGVFGTATRSATQRVQEQFDLVEDGVVGPRTRTRAVQLALASGVGVPGSLAGSVPSTGERRLREGMRGDDVRAWQRQINVAVDLGRLDRARIAEDGRFGPTTRAATIQLQRTIRVTADGVVGPVTRQGTGWLLEG